MLELTNAIHEYLAERYDAIRGVLYQAEPNNYWYTSHIAYCLSTITYELDHLSAESWLSDRPTPWGDWPDTKINSRIPYDDPHFFEHLTSAIQAHRQHAERHYGDKIAEIVTAAAKGLRGESNELDYQQIAWSSKP